MVVKLPGEAQWLPMVNECPMTATRVGPAARRRLTTARISASPRAPSRRRTHCGRRDVSRPSSRPCGPRRARRLHRWQTARRRSAAPASRQTMSVMHRRQAGRAAPRTRAGQTGQERERVLQLVAVALDFENELVEAGDAPDSRERLVRRTRRSLREHVHGRSLVERHWR